MLKIAIVEDWQEDSEKLKTFLNRYSGERQVEMEISVFGDGMSFLDEYKVGYDLILMDIQMPHMDGLAAAQKIRLFDQGVGLIFVTNMAQYAFAGYDVDAMDFLLKPFVYEHFCLKLDRVIRQYERKKNSFYGIQNQTESLRVKTSEIMYIERLQHNLIFHLADGRKIMDRGALKTVQEQLPKESFFRCHTSFLVNLEYVWRIEKSIISLSDQTEIPVSRNARQGLLDAFTRYMGGTF